MDADSICNDFHLRMTVATTEHERFEQLLSVLVPTPDTVVSAKNLEAINDARNVVFEAFAAVCEASDELEDCADELDPDESKVIDDAYATVKRWSEEIDQVMVQIRQVVWDSQHGHIQRLISGTHSRSGKRTFRNPVEEPEAVAVAAVADGAEEPVEEETDDEEEPEATESEDEVFEDDPTEEPVETEETDEADVEDETDDEESDESEEDEEGEPADADEEKPTEVVIVTDEPDEPVETEEPETAPVVADGAEEPVVQESAPAVQEPEKAPTATISPEELKKIYEEVYKKVLEEGYNVGAADTLAKLNGIKEADETADLIAAESKPHARKPKTTKPKTEAKPAKKEAPAKKEEEPVSTEAKPSKPAKKRRIFKKKGASE